MKAMEQPCMTVHRKDSARPSSGAAGFKVCKAGGKDAEIQALYAKLKALVPSGDKKRSKTELLQGVIDYIVDLTDALDSPLPLPSKVPLAESTDANIMDPQSRDARPAA